MKKIMLLTILLCLMLCPLPASAQENGPSRVDTLVLHDDLLVLWSMGLKKSGPRSPDALCRDALYFVILSEGGKSCGVARAKQPGLFQGMADNYQAFVPKQQVEEVARTMFAQEVKQHLAPRGTVFNGKGYFLDFDALSEDTGYLCGLMPDDRRPGHVHQPIVEPIDDTSWTLYARLLRIMKDMDGGVLVMKSASFAGEVSFRGGKLRLTSFTITDEDS